MTRTVPSTAAARVSVSGLSAGYGGEATYPERFGSASTDAGRSTPTLVIDEVSFDLLAGRCLAVVGRSGCGKSTLLHVLAGLHAPAAGEVWIDDALVAAAAWDGTRSPGCHAGHAAYMLQQDLLLPWKTALGNATFASRMAARGRRGRGARGIGTARASFSSEELDDRARQLLREFGLGDAIEARPSQLSGGMRQRVALARTMLMGSGLVLLDEPFGSLDAVTRAEMHAWLLGVMDAHPATWVLVTHDVDEAVLLGDHVAVLRGRPARLEGWIDAALSRRDRRRAAGARAGEPASDDAVRGEEAGRQHLAAAAAAVSRSLQRRESAA